jgi:phosphoribosylglycinamide formyltransferase 1
MLTHLRSDHKILRIAVLASGRGSNLRALHAACQQGEIKGAIVGVFSDKPNSKAIAFSKEQGLHTQPLAPREYATREAFDEHLFSLIQAVQPDLIVCAGYLRLISAQSVQSVLPKMINIHPSLLPKFPGLDTHSRALNAGEALHGASIHVLTPELDAGPVISQATISVHVNESAETLSQRVLAVEHPLLVHTIKEIADGHIQLFADHVLYRHAPLRAPLQLNINTLNALEKTS